MGSFKRPRAFDPLDLEIMDCVYKAAWAQLEAREPFRDRERDGERQNALRQLVFNSVGSDKINFDTLCDRVLANMSETWIVFRPSQNRSSPKVSA
jgi:hypothetical protein